MHLTKAFVGFVVCTCTSKYVHLSLQLRVDSDWARRVKGSMSHLNTNSDPTPAEILCIRQLSQNI